MLICRWVFASRFYSADVCADDDQQDIAFARVGQCGMVKGGFGDTRASRMMYH
jgi:hypothetical protein